jgi:RNA polymerase sigma factor (sigma-70 family)
MEQCAIGTRAITPTRLGLPKRESVRKWKTGKQMISFPVSPFEADYRKAVISDHELTPELLPLPGPDQRKPPVVEQIVDILEQRPESWLKYLTDFGRGLYPETLVYVARESVQLGEGATGEYAIDLLLGIPLHDGTFADGIPLVAWRDNVPKLSFTIEEFVQYETRRSGMAGYPDEVNITRADLHVKVLERIRAGSAIQGFWEVNFLVALRRAMQQVLGKHQTPKWRPGRAIVHEIVHPDEVGDSRWSPERALEEQEFWTVFEQGLATLTDDERIVVDELYLRPRDGGPPTQEELAAELDVTDKTIRNRRNRAVAKLRNVLSRAGYSSPFPDEEPSVPPTRTPPQSGSTKPFAEGEG